MAPSSLQDQYPEVITHWGRTLGSFLVGAVEQAFEETVWQVVRLERAATEDPAGKRVFPMVAEVEVFSFSSQEAALETLRKLIQAETQAGVFYDLRPQGVPRPSFLSSMALWLRGMAEGADTVLRHVQEKAKASAPRVRRAHALKPQR